jgi:hypothetical protein
MYGECSCSGDVMTAIGQHEFLVIDSVERPSENQPNFQGKPIV